LIVMKFGGTSVADAERISAVADIVRARMDRRPVVVLSALAGVTDLLEQAFLTAGRSDLDGLEPLMADLARRHRWAIAGCIEDPARRHGVSLEVDGLFEDLRERLRSVRILGEGTPRARDAVLAFGETLSGRIIAEVFTDRGLPARWVCPEDVMMTDDRFGEAEPDLGRVREACGNRLIPLLEAGELPVTGGFVGVDGKGRTTTLGRGGSDTSATVLGLALEAEEIQIWTDVDGLMSADPRLVPAARTLPTIAFREAAELAYYGAKVLDPISVASAVRRRTPVRVLNSLRPEGAGTLIVPDVESDDLDKPVAVASRSNLQVVRAISRRTRPAPDFLPRILQCCSAEGRVPKLVLSTEAAVTLVVGSGAVLDALKGSLGAEADVELLDNRAVVCVIGAGVGRDTPLRAGILTELARFKPDLIAVGASRTSVAAVLEEGLLAPALRELHRRFFEREEGE